MPRVLVVIDGIASEHFFSQFSVGSIPLFIPEGPWINFQPINSTISNTSTFVRCGLQIPAVALISDVRIIAILRA